MTANSSSNGTGDITVTGGSVAVIGTGTLFTKELVAGGYILIAQDTVPHKILSITDDTHLTLVHAHPGISGNIFKNLAFQFSNGDFTPNIGLPSPGPHAQDSNKVLVRAWKIIDREIPKS